MLTLFKSAWSYRHFILSSIRNDMKIRFTRSRFGGMWMILHPLTQVAIFAFVLSAVLSAKLPGIDNRYAYAIYLTSGMLAWNLFTEIITRCLTLFIDNGNLMKKIAFPRIALPLITLGTALLNNVLLLLAILLIFGLLGHPPAVSFLWLPLLMGLTALLSTGLGLILGVLNVFLRDLEQVVPILLQLMFWFTPIVYPANIIPEIFRPWLCLNPLYPLVTSYQGILALQQQPDLPALLPAVLIAVTSTFLALFLFRKASPEMVDVL